MDQWPPSLVKELAERRCILILGAGVSASSQTDSGERPPLWPPFLRDASALLDKQDKAYVEDLISRDQFLDAAEIIVQRTNPPDFSEFVRRVFVEPRFKVSDVHRIIAALDAKIVLTTNYDTLYEDYCSTALNAQAYNVSRYYDAHALNDIRSTTRVILKAHGCVTDPTKIILSRTQYFDAHKDYVQFFNLLDALFLTNTLLFIGCGLDDPGIVILLENANLRTQTQHPHYALVEAGRHDALVSALQTTTNLKLIQYDHAQHSQVPTRLKELESLVSEFRATHD